MAGRPAATLLHLGPGLGNGLANLHNARRARTPIVNLVGDHATYHKKFDAPLESAIEGPARIVSPGFVRWGSTRPTPWGSTPPRRCGRPSGPRARWRPWWSRRTCRGARRRGVVATAAAPPLGPDPARAEAAAVANALRRAGAAAPPRQRRARPRRPLAAAESPRRLGRGSSAETFPARLARGAGIAAGRAAPLPRRDGGGPLAGLRHLVLADAKPPVSFFAYPDRPSWLVPDGCEVHVLAGPTDDVCGHLEALADELGARPAAALRSAPPAVPGPAGD